MKSERQAERIAAVCTEVGLPGAIAAVSRGGATLCSFGWAGAADIGDGSVATFGGAPPLAAARQADERPATLARRQSTISGLVGAIQEQCSAISLRVHAPRTAFNSSWDTVCVGGAGGGAGVCAEGAATGGAVAAGDGAAGVCGLAVTVSTALLHDVERLSW